MEEDRGIWVIDVETILSCFTYTGYNIHTEEVVQFVLHEELFQLNELIEHLSKCKGHITFNGVNFDYPIIHYITNLQDSWCSLLFEKMITKFEVIQYIYNKAQELINNNSSFGTAINLKEVLIPQLDLYRIWHFNNKARSQSLKGLEIAMNYPNVMDMPIKHDKIDVSLEEVEQILEYNLNDVMATYEFYKLTKSKIDLRKDLDVKYSLNCINYPDSKIGEQLVLKLYCEKTNKNKWEVKEQRTNRSSIAFKDCIFDYIKFESKEFNVLLNKLKSKTITETKDSIEESVIYKGAKYDYGTGGLHQCIKPGIYISDDNYQIRDLDVSSLYPSIAVINKLYPKHLGEEFIDVYGEILKDRIQAKKEGNMSLSDGYKLSLNSCYGKSNDKDSFLYDPLYTMKTTLNGQLMLSMLIEWLVDNISDIQILQVNTDGITVRINKNYIGDYEKLCRDWQLYTNLQLEFVDYTKMIIRDVNNYTAVTDRGKIKYKGTFEIEKEYHKDNSFKIVPIALSNYFVHNIDIGHTIRSHTNIYDFCGRQKFRGDDWGEMNYLESDEFGNPIHVIEKQQKNVRFYISTNGGRFIKYYNSGGNEFLYKKYKTTIFNKYVELDNYFIDYQFYINECNKIIRIIEDKQLDLFE